LRVAPGFAFGLLVGFGALLLGCRTRVLVGCEARELVPPLA
jgi:hypothetical protein